MLRLRAEVVVFFLREGLVVGVVAGEEGAGGALPQRRDHLPLPEHDVLDVKGAVHEVFPHWGQVVGAEGGLAFCESGLGGGAFGGDAPGVALGVAAGGTGGGDGDGGAGLEGGLVVDAAGKDGFWVDVSIRASW